MAITAISKLTAEDYIAQSDREDESPTRFRLRPLNGLQYMEVISELSRGDDGQLRISGKGMKLALQYGLVGWSNFRDSDGKEIKFNPVNVEKIPPVILSELAGEIINRSEIGEDERKN